MNVSNNGLAFVAVREACVLTAYWDRHHYAIGFGINDAKLKGGETITLEQAIVDFVKFMEDISRGVSRLFDGVAFLPNMHDAICSAAYNFGVGGLSEQHDLMRSINDLGGFPADADLNGVKEAFEAIELNNHRRKMEAKMFVEGDYGDISTLKLWKAGKNPRVDAFELMPMPRFL